MVSNATFINITYIVTVSFIGGGNGVPREIHRLAACRRQTLSYNVVSNTPRLGGIRTPNGSGDRH